MECRVGTSSFFSNQLPPPLPQYTLVTIHAGNIKTSQTLWVSRNILIYVFLLKTAYLQWNHYFITAGPLLFTLFLKFQYIRLTLVHLWWGERGRNNSLLEKKLTATQTCRRIGKLSHCFKRSLTRFVKVSDNIFIRFLNIASLLHVIQAIMLISDSKGLKSLSGSFCYKVSFCELT